MTLKKKTLLQSLGSIDRRDLETRLVTRNLFVCTSGSDGRLMKRARDDTSQKESRARDARANRVRRPPRKLRPNAAVPVIATTGDDFHRGTERKPPATTAAAAPRRKRPARSALFRAFLRDPIESPALQRDLRVVSVPPTNSQSD